MCALSIIPHSKNFTFPIIPVGLMLAAFVSSVLLVGCGVRDNLPAALPSTLPNTPAEFHGMVWIPAGEFQMGSKHGDSDERPVHAVYLDAYYIDIYEVTNARYAECIKAGICTAESGSDRDISNYPDYPVGYVNWNQARTYCQWRGGDLPSEAQWEKASRGGLVGKQYPWGDEEPVCQKDAKNGAQFYDCEPRGPAPVGNFSPNSYGLYDMAGNVFEWVQDWYLETFYTNSPFENPTGPYSGEFRVLRGGSWGYDAQNMHVAGRSMYAPSFANANFGFRCSRSQASE